MRFFKQIRKGSKIDLAGVNLEAVRKSRRVNKKAQQDYRVLRNYEMTLTITYSAAALTLHAKNP